MTYRADRRIGSHHVVRLRRPKQVSIDECGPEVAARRDPAALVDREILIEGLLPQHDERDDSERYRQDRARLVYRRLTTCGPTAR